jgi:hypothetical protein
MGRVAASARATNDREPHSPLRAGAYWSVYELTHRAPEAGRWVKERLSGMPRICWQTIFIVSRRAIHSDGRILAIHRLSEGSARCAARLLRGVRRMAVLSDEDKEILLEKPRIQYDCCRSNLDVEMADLRDQPRRVRSADWARAVTMTETAATALSARPSAPDPASIACRRHQGRLPVGLGPAFPSGFNDTRCGRITELRSITLKARRPGTC